MTRREEKLSEEQKGYLRRRLCDYDEALADARRLTQEFAEMTRKKRHSSTFKGNKYLASSCHAGRLAAPFLGR